jgi:hypothetical protein
MRSKSRQRTRVYYQPWGANGHYHAPPGLRQAPRVNSNFALILNKDLR